MILWLATSTPSASQKMYIRSLGKDYGVFMRMFYRGGVSYYSDLFKEKGKMLKKR